MERIPEPRPAAMTAITRRVMVAALLAILSAGLLVGAGGRSPQDTEGIRVEFSQLDWLGAGKSIRFPQSRVGVAELSFEPEAASMLVDSGGFVNLVIQVPGGRAAEWAVRNLYLHYESERFMLGSRPSVQFSLTTPNGVRVPRLGYFLTVTPEPLASPPAGEFVLAPVALEGYRVGGRFGSEVSSLPLYIQPWTGPKALQSIRVRREVTTTKPAGELPEINEDPNGCAPAAVARSIRYMLENSSADEWDSAQNIYDQLWDLMETSGQSGTTDPNMVSGKQQYAENNGLDITTTLADNQLGSIGNAMDTLANGGDVELLISWVPPPANGASGHVAMIISIVDLGNGQYQITYIDDANQTDGLPGNDTHVIIVNADGSFPGGQVDGFLIETMNAPASPTPTPAPSPTPAPGGTMSTFH